MRTEILNRLWRAKRWVRYHIGPHALILMYHRVAHLENDPHLLAVTPEHFAAHLEIIRKRGVPFSLIELASRIREGNLPNRAVVLTFDDGYVDSLWEAKPLLERFDVPATVFITAGQLDAEYEFWWDELDRLLLQPGILPACLQLDVNGETHEWDLGIAAKYSRAEYLRDAGWHIECEVDPTPRQSIFRKLFSLLLPLPEQDKRRVLEHLRVWAGCGHNGRLSHRALTRAELRSLADDRLIEVGAHTMSHPLLAALPASEQAMQIRESKACLDAVLQKPVSSFAYPNGSYTPETVAMVKTTGFDVACTSDANVVWQDAAPLQLPRLGVRDWDRDAFARWLAWWIDG